MKSEFFFKQVCSQIHIVDTSNFLMEVSDENYLNTVEAEFQCLESSFVDEEFFLLATIICKVNGISFSKSLLTLSQMFAVLLNLNENLSQRPKKKTCWIQ